MEEKTFVDDINRSVYDIKNEEKDAYRIKQGLTPEIVEKISEEKHDPAWMREFRISDLSLYRYTTICRCLTGVRLLMDSIWIILLLMFVPIRI